MVRDLTSGWVYEDVPERGENSNYLTMGQRTFRSTNVGRQDSLRRESKENKSLSVLCQQPVSLVLMPLVLARKARFWICYCFLGLWAHNEWYYCFLFSPAFREYTWSLFDNCNHASPSHNKQYHGLMWFTSALSLKNSEWYTVVSVFWFL